MQTFEPEEIKYTYSPEHAPIGTVAAGESFTVITADGFTGKYDDPANFSRETAAWVEENLDGVTGPISVEGAAPGGAVAITIEDLEVNTKGTVVISRCEAHSPQDWWHEEERVVNFTVSGGAIRLRDGWSVPARPLIGCIATAPARETVFSKHEGSYGGNMDVREITEGATVILPAEIPGAGLYFGDCKAAMGDGEVVCAPECGTRILVNANPMDRPRGMGSPRIVTSELMMTLVSAPSLSDAARAAFRELKVWIQNDWGLSSDDAAVLMGIGAHCGIGQVSNLLHTAKCSIDRSLLPPDRPSKLDSALGARR